MASCGLTSSMLVPTGPIGRVARWARQQSRCSWWCGCQPSGPAGGPHRSRSATSTATWPGWRSSCHPYGWSAPAIRLVCPWREWSRLLKWEQAEVTLQDRLTNADLDKALVSAANAAFGTAGEDIYLEDFRGYVRQEPVEALERVAKRAGWPPERTPWTQRPNFVRPGGGAYVAHRHLIELAHDFAAREPDAVSMYVDAEEAKYRERGFCGERFWHEHLLELGPAHSIVRDWAGTTQRTSLGKDVHDLRALVYEALNALRKAGATKEADSIERKLNRHPWRVGVGHHGAAHLVRLHR